MELRAAVRAEACGSAAVEDCAGLGGASARAVADEERPSGTVMAKGQNADVASEPLGEWQVGEERYGSLRE